MASRQGRTRSSSNWSMPTTNRLIKKWYGSPFLSEGNDHVNRDTDFQHHQRADAIPSREERDVCVPVCALLSRQGDCHDPNKRGPTYVDQSQRAPPISR